MRKASENLMENNRIASLLFQDITMKTKKKIVKGKLAAGLKNKMKKFTKKKVIKPKAENLTII